MASVLDACSGRQPVASTVTALVTEQKSAGHGGALLRFVRCASARPCRLEHHPHVGIAHIGTPVAEESAPVDRNFRNGQKEKVTGPPAIAAQGFAFSSGPLR